MTADTKRTYEQLERLFHEPARLSILSVLAGERAGVSFPELKVSLGLTDGNLNRHVKTLADGGVVRVEKAFVDDKPRTTLFLTEEGAERFTEYLDALGQVLADARRAARRAGSAAGMRLATS